MSRCTDTCSRGLERGSRRMKISVLNVGNAAATVLGEDDDTPRVLLDGGRTGNLADLEWYLTNRSPHQQTHPSVHNIDTLVVSHFDIDHWGGLSALGRKHSPKGQGAPLTIYHSRMPEATEDIPAAMFFLRFMTGELPMPFTADSLAANWRPGRSVRLSGLRRGDAVTLASTKFRVLWPPHVLPPGRANGLSKALTKVREVAKTNPYFGKLFDELHRHPFGAGDGDAPNGAERSIGDPETDIVGALNEAELGSDDEVSNDFYALPDELIGPARIIHRWNNDLSIVLAAEDDSFLAMGDVTSSWAVSGALEGAAKHFDRMLAPHHGTHPDENLPSAGECFMQTGHRHSTKCHLHVTAHTQAEHVCTHTSSKPGNPIREVAACGEPGCSHKSTGGFFRR